MIDPTTVERAGSRVPLPMSPTRAVLEECFQRLRDERRPALPPALRVSVRARHEILGERVLNRMRFARFVSRALASCHRMRGTRARTSASETSSTLASAPFCSRFGTAATPGEISSAIGDQECQVPGNGLQGRPLRLLPRSPCGDASREPREIDAVPSPPVRLEQSAELHASSRSVTHGLSPNPLPLDRLTGNPRALGPGAPPGSRATSPPPG